MSVLFLCCVCKRTVGPRSMGLENRSIMDATYNRKRSRPWKPGCIAAAVTQSSPSHNRRPNLPYSGSRAATPSRYDNQSDPEPDTYPCTSV